ncbi:MAG: hypothetical protein RSA55_08910, partial [Clostridia bacterium]
FLHLLTSSLGVAQWFGCMALHALGFRIALLHYQRTLAYNVVGTPYMVSAQLALGVFDEALGIAVYSVMMATNHAGWIRCTCEMAI